MLFVREILVPLITVESALTWMSQASNEGMLVTFTFRMTVLPVFARAAFAGAIKRVGLDIAWTLSAGTDTARAERRRSGSSRRRPAIVVRLAGFDFT